MDKKRVSAKTKQQPKTETVKKLTFTAPQFVSAEKSAGWFVGIFVLFALIIVFTLYQHDFRLGAIFLLGAIVFYQMALANPSKVNLEFNPSGIIFDTKKYSWNEFRSFGLWEEKNHYIVHLDKKSSVAGPLILTIPDSKDRPLVPVILGSVLAEKYHPHITISDLFARIIRY